MRSHVQSSTSLLDLLQSFANATNRYSNSHSHAALSWVVGVLCWRKMILGSYLDEGAVSAVLLEERDFCVWGRGASSPAENAGVEGLDSFEVGAGNFGPGEGL